MEDIIRFKEGGNFVYQIVGLYIILLSFTRDKLKI